MITLAGFLLIPGSMVPLPAWPGLFGGYNLTIYFIQATRLKPARDAEVGRFLAGVSLASMAIAMAIGVGGPVLLLAIVLGSILLAGLGWAVCKASSDQTEEPPDR